jgi:hypothetical protein
MGSLRGSEVPWPTTEKPTQAFPPLGLQGHRRGSYESPKNVPTDGKALSEMESLAVRRNTSSFPFFYSPKIHGISYWPN